MMMVMTIAAASGSETDLARFRDRSPEFRTPRRLIGRNRAWHVDGIRPGAQSNAIC